jgi:hypothetical protein
MIPSMVPVNKNLQFQVKYQLYTCNSKGTKIYKNPNLKTSNNYNAPAKKIKRTPISTKQNHPQMQKHNKKRK